MSVVRLNNSATGQAIKDIRLGQLRSVIITDDGFEPSVLSVNTGDTIIFTNNGTRAQTVTSDLFGSPLLFPGDSYRVAFLGNESVGYWSLSGDGFRGEIRIESRG